MKTVPPIRPSIRLRRGAALLALALCLPSAGCFGTFELTKRVYAFNQDIDQDKWIRWLAFLGMNVLPVYPFSAALDAVFANSVEFWTGQNPIRTASAEPQVLLGAAGERLEVTARGDGFELHLRQADGREQLVRLQREGDAAVARDADGALLGRVTEVSGRPLFEPAR